MGRATLTVGFLVQRMRDSLHHRSAPACLIHGMEKLEVHIQRGVIGRVVEVKATNSNRRLPVHPNLADLVNAASNSGGTKRAYSVAPPQHPFFSSSTTRSFTTVLLIFSTGWQSKTAL